MSAIGVPVLGALARDEALAWPERHLGLVQAGEISWLDPHLDRLAEAIAAACDLEAIRAAAHATAPPLDPVSGPIMTPPAQRIAVARDAAFSFLYPHILSAWRAAGAEILPFSPLNDEAPDARADLVWLPGGYPELHAGRLAAQGHFLDGLRQAAARGPVHGECGGYMTLGQGLIDAEGRRHAMAGLLGLETDFARRRLHLGYRRARLLADCALGPAGSVLRGHEFHYARVVTTGGDEALFAVEDANGTAIPEGGSRRGSVSGSFFHVIAGHVIAGAE
jgi:cobyrinic acid a,c-diamide synthase